MGTDVNLTTDAPLCGVPITSLAAYLAARQELVASREAFFFALRTYLRPEQRADGRILGDRLWRAPARAISEAEWIVSPTRGYLCVLENPDAGRNFQLRVIQQGVLLRVGVVLPAWHADTTQPTIRRILATYKDQVPTQIELPSEQLQLEWQFDARTLYNNVQEMETALYLVDALFESALQALVPTTKEFFQ